MAKVNGWVIHRKGTERTVLQIMGNSLAVTPYFSSLAKLQAFGDVLQNAGIDMSIYESAYGEGIENHGDLWLDPDGEELAAKIKLGLHQWN